MSFVCATEILKSASSPNIMHLKEIILVGTIFPWLGGHAFTSHSSSPMAFMTDNQRSWRRQRQARCFVARINNDDASTPSAFSAAGDDGMSDEELLQQTSLEQLIQLCQQFSLETDGTKEVLLKRLRDFGREQTEKERQRLEERRKRVEEGSDDERERFEFLDGEVEDIEDEPIFYYAASSPDVPTNSTVTKKSQKSKKGPDSTKPATTAADTSSQAKLIAPPPPPVEPNEKGERVVTVYSTKDMNDLTGVAAAQPGQAAQKDAMLAGGTPDPVNAPWDTNNPRKQTKDSASSSEIERAKEEVTELVSTLLSMTGAPGFQQDEDDELASMMGPNVVRRQSTFESPKGFVGFDPASVPTELLTKSSRSLRTGRGTVLSDVLREFELRGIGYDGAAGDSVDRGGGHYRQVSKVRSFLEGFRRAEVRRLARETATLLLDKLVSEGIEGLDMTLATMTRSSDETSDEAGELNDSLLDYLNEAIRQQEKKVEQVIDSVKKIEELENAVIDAELEADNDAIEKLWSVDTTDDGQRVETFDPNSKENKQTLKEELAIQQHQMQSIAKPIAPKSAPEQLLLLLKLLRERVKTEAAFSHDEKSRNLRVLAYCLNLRSNPLRKELIVKEFGSSLDRLDSFAELVASSIEYAESTSHQLQPSKQGPLNVTLLKGIHALTKDIREKQAWKASGATSPQVKL